MRGDDEMSQLRVIFRKFADGDVIAIFPELAGTNDPWTCLDYMHIGQHGSGDVDFYSTLKPATPAEYAPLYNELRGIYETGKDAVELKVAKRFSRLDYLKRLEQVRR
jgi:hypothetical protein